MWYLATDAFLQKKKNEQNAVLHDDNKKKGEITAASIRVVCNPVNMCSWWCFEPSQPLRIN